MLALRALVLVFGVLLLGEVLAHTQLGQVVVNYGSSAPSVMESVSLAADGQRMAVPLPFQLPNGQSGYLGVRAFEWSGSDWQQIGDDLEVGAQRQYVSLSADGSRIAIGSQVTYPNPGLPRFSVYQWSGSNWQPLGTGNDAESTSSRVSLSADGNRLAMGNFVYEWSGSVWQQLGDPIPYGNGSMFLSADGERLALGSYGSSDAGYFAGQARVYEWSGSGWQQLGGNLNGLAEGDNFGISVALSMDGERLAVGSHKHGGRGQVRVFEWTGSEWQQIGASVDGEKDFDSLGRSVSLDAAGNRLAIGAPDADSAGFWGHVHVYEWLNNTWVKLGAVVKNPVLFTQGFGGSVSLSADGSRLAAAALFEHASVWAVDPRPGLTLAGLEVVQVVQDWRNSATLVAGKKTVIRAHLEDPIGATLGPGIFRIHGYGGAGLSEPLNPPYIDNGPGGGGEPLNLPVDADPITRADKSRSPTFYLPQSWLSEGPKRFVFSSSSIPLGTCADHAPPTHNDCSATVAFQAQKPMVLHLIPTRFHDAAGNRLETNSTDLAAVCSQIERRFPAHPVVCVPESNPIEFPRPTTATFPSSHEILGRTEIRKWLYGQCPWPICEGFYLAVTAFSACKVAGCSQPAIGGQGNFPDVDDFASRTAWSVAASPADPKRSLVAPHEIGHTVDLNHTAKTDDNPYPKGTCNEEADKGVLYPPDNSFPFPYYSGDDPLLGPVGDDQLLVFGYDSVTDSVIAHSENALMSYCDLQRPGTTSWPDIGSYNKVAQDFAAAVAPAAQALAENDAEFYYLTGSIDLAADSAELDPVERMVPPFVLPPPPQSGDWLLIVHTSGTPDASIPLHLKISPNDPSQARFAAFVEYDPAVTGFSVQREGVTLTQVTASDNAPVITITAPAAGSQFLSEEVVLEWNASDADGDDLVFLVDYSADGGISWVNISAPWPESPFSVFSGSVQPSQNALFRVTALDGFHSTTATLPGTVVVKAVELIHDDGFE